MWFPDNNPGCPREQTIEYSSKHKLVTTDLPPGNPPFNRGSGRARRVTAVIAWGKRPVPFRTRKLRPTAPMVLHSGGCGRVGHRRTHIRQEPRPKVGALPF